MAQRVHLNRGFTSGFYCETLPYLSPKDTVFFVWLLSWAIWILKLFGKWRQFDYNACSRYDQHVALVFVALGNSWPTKCSLGPSNQVLASIPKIWVPLYVVMKCICINHGSIQPKQFRTHRRRALQHEPWLNMTLYGALNGDRWMMGKWRRNLYTAALMQGTSEL